MTLWWHHKALGGAAGGAAGGTPRSSPSLRDRPHEAKPIWQRASHLRVCSGPFQAVPVVVGCCASITHSQSGWGWQGPPEVICSKPLLKEAHPEPDGPRPPLKRARLHLLCTLPSGIYICGEDPPRLLFSRLNSPSSLSPSSLERCSSPFPIAVALHWTLSSLSLSLLSWGAQHRTQPSRGGLTSAEQRGRISSLDLLATLLLVQPRTPLAFFAASASTWCPPGPSLQSCFPAAHPQLVLVPGAVPPQGQDFACPLVELQEVPVSPFLQPVEVPLGGSATSWCLSHSSQCGIVSKLAEGALCPIIQSTSEEEEDQTQY